MYDYIKGIYIGEKILPDGLFITVETSGIGYLIKTASRTLNELPDKNSEIKIFVTLIHREDSMIFCGFLHKEERDLFNILQTVSGVGVKASLALLDEFSVTELISTVIKENYKELSRTKGIGQKSAQKIVLELKDKLLARQDYIIPEISDNKVEETPCILEAKSVLFSLGYTKDEIDTALKAASSVSNKNNSEEILKTALQYLAQQ